MICQCGKGYETHLLYYKGREHRKGCDACARRFLEGSNPNLSATKLSKPNVKIRPKYPFIVELHGGDPKCKHDIVSSPGGGINCTKCPAWFCY